MMNSFNTPVMHIFSASTIVLFFISTSQADIIAANKSNEKSIQPTAIESDDYEY